MFSCSIVSHSFRPHGPMPGFLVLHHLPDLAQTHVHWVGDDIKPSFCLSSPSPPASGTFPMSQLFTTGGQNTGASASALVLPMNIQGWFPLELTGLIFFLSDPQGFSQAPQFKSSNSLVLSLLYGPTLTSIHDYWKTITLITQTFVGKVMSSLFNMLSRFVKVFFHS